MDKLPATVKSGIPKAEAEELQKKLSAGATLSAVHFSAGAGLLGVIHVHMPQT